MRIGILGIGAIGGFLASIFSQYKQDIICICREETCQEIKTLGLSIQSENYPSKTFFPKTVHKLNQDVDFLFIATKSQYLAEVLKQVNLKHTSSALIIPLLNGIGFNELLVEYFGNRVCTGTIGSIEVIKKDGKIFHESSSLTPKIELASKSNALQNKLVLLEDSLKNTGIDVAISDSESDVVWNKLLRLNAIASFTAAYQKTIGVIRSDSKLRKDMEIFIKESSLVAALDNYQSNVYEIIDQIDRLPFNLMTSLQRDIRAGKSSELESITGGVLNKGLKNNINLPMHLLIYNKILSHLQS